jgi:hypothetical protein
MLQINRKIYLPGIAVIIILVTILMYVMSCSPKPSEESQTVNDTEYRFQYHVIDSGSVHNPWAKMIGDIDGNGNPDIIIGGQNGPIVWYRNPDWKKFKIGEGGYDTVDGETGDIDGDGDTDIVMGGLIWY